MSIEIIDYGFGVTETRERFYTEQYVNGLTQRIAELEEQLKNAIVPPVKLGSMIYKLVYNANIDKYEIYNYSLDYCDNEKYYTSWESLINSFRTHYFKDFNKLWFATKEEAEWHKEFGCIERTERLELPTWEEFLILEKIYSFKSKNNQIVVLFSDNHTIYLEDENWNILREELTKENYTLACRKAKELFLGE